ncbi:MAG: hypothetical protein EOP04_13125 [Proteobacteria bacterium]|nr:MAG: hypothetical protein EOP04_13125 [Pseudomonadota bacterium]
MQVTAALLLLIPRTVTLGVLLYFPIILNIFVLSYSVRFEGSSLTSPLMVMGCLFLMGWNYDRIKYLLPIDHPNDVRVSLKPLSNVFPVKFALVAVAMVTGVVLFVLFGWEIAPRNNLKDCNSQFIGTNRTKAGATFCDCIHKQGLPLEASLRIFRQSGND